MPSPKTRRRATAVIAAAALGAWPLTLSFAASQANPPSPGTFKGWAFDACTAPSANTMDAWLKDKTDPYRGIGIYISGSLRACSQPNLTADWVSHVQQTGWHLLPLTVGPQASCTGFSQVINANPANTYAAARRQGAAQADDAVAHAQALGIVRGSTLFYDMENWHTGYNNCDASALWFMSAWTNRLHAYGYAGGTYVSGLSGARLLNAMADATPSGFVLPDQIWTAEWNDQENVKSDYLDSDNWANHQRAHQYWGGHNATNSKITLNIDSNYVDLRTVSPLPAVVPDSAIGAPLPLPSPTPVTPTPSATPTKAAKPSPSATPSKSASPTTQPTPSKTVSPTPTAQPTATSTKTTAASKPVEPTPTPQKTTKPAKPSATPTRPTATTTTSSAKPTTKVTTKPTTQPKPASLSSTAGNATSPLGSATGIKAPTQPAARRLAPKLADRVPTMVTSARQTPTDLVPRAQTRTKTLRKAPTEVSSTPAATTPAPQAQLQQPSMPYNAPQVAAGPSLMTKLWNGAGSILAVIGHALAAAGAWVGRGFGALLGW